MNREPADRSDSNVGAATALLIMMGIMLGSGLGAVFGNVSIGIPAGLAAGGLAAMLLHAFRR